MSSSEFEEFCSSSELENSDWEGPSEPSFTFKPVTLHEISLTQDSLVAMVAETTDLPTNCALFLLSRNKWKDDLAISRVFDDPTYTETLKSKFIGVELRTSQVECCPLCCEEEVEAVDIGCGHAVCTDCFGQYLRLRMADREVFHFPCPGDSNCKLCCTDAILEHFYTETEFRTLLKFRVEPFIAACRDKYCGCPSPDCRFYLMSREPINERLLGQEEVLSSTSTRAVMAECNCSCIFCFLCGESHLPLSCTLTRRWLKLSNDASFEWIQSFTKACPKCHSPIQKNQGCDHMACPCGYHFCWVCLSHFPGYQHRCSTTKLVMMEKAELSASDKSHNARLLLYSPRVVSQLTHRKYHLNILSHQNKARNVADPLDEFYAALPTDEGTSLDAHRVLANSRGLVAWTFVLLLHLKDSNGREILENLTIDLKDASEALSTIIKGRGIPDAKSVTQKARYIEQRSSILMSHITTTSWSFYDPKEILEC